MSRIGQPRDNSYALSVADAERYGNAAADESFALELLRYALIIVLIERTVDVLDGDLCVHLSHTP